MRIAAGILTIVGALLGGSVLVGSLHGIHIYGFLIYLPILIGLVGGINALKRKRWTWALAGAICSLLFPFFGIPAIILLVKRKSEFD